MAKLIANVIGRDGSWYGPDYPDAGDPPDEVAAQMTNPALWDDGKGPGPSADDKAPRRRTTSAS